MLLLLPEIVPNQWFNGVSSNLTVIPLDKDHRTWFLFQPIIWQFPNLLPNINPAIHISKAMVNNTFVSYIGISNVAMSLWSSFIPNPTTDIETCRNTSPSNINFQLSVSCRDVYDGIVDMCSFDLSTTDLLKSCHGNHVALRHLYLS